MLSGGRRFHFRHSKVQFQRSATDNVTLVLVQRDPALQLQLTALRVSRATGRALEAAARDAGRDVGVVGTYHVPDPGFVVEENRVGVPDEVFAGDAKTVKDRE